jgi:hypothetical protein
MQAGSGERGRIPVLAGWMGCFEVVADAGEFGLPMRPRAHADGPELVCGFDSIPEGLSEPALMHVWLPMLLHHAVAAAIEDQLSGSRRLTTGRWPRFKGLCGRSAGMAWGDIVAAARRDGVDATADWVATSLYVEDGLQASLVGLSSGMRHLRLVRPAAAAD